MPDICINSSVSQQNFLKYIKRKLQIGFFTLSRVFSFCGGILMGFISDMCAEISAMELMFIKMTHVYTFICQLFFMTLCEVAIVRVKENQTKHEERLVSGLTTLLFYSVFAYFASRIRDNYLHDWNRPRHSLNIYRDYAKWIFKMAVEWAKAILVVVCLREQGMKYRPDFCFNFVTFTYYCCTEKILTEILENFIASLNLEMFDSLEHLYVPIFLRSYTLLSAGAVTAYMFATPYSKYAILSSYFIIYLNGKDLILNYIGPLMLEKHTYESFKMASNKDIEVWDDICAVCLNRMSKAKITPCNHLFHPHCLKRCLKTSYQCPLCKQNFVR